MVAIRVAEIVVNCGLRKELGEYKGWVECGAIYNCCALTPDALTPDAMLDAIKESKHD